MSSLPLKKKRNFAGISLYVAVTLLAVIGTVFIYSASNYSAKATYGDSFYFVKKQLIGIALGIVAMTLTSIFDYNKLKKFTLPVAIISFVSPFSPLMLSLFI